jgi:predicted PurR-regulated permease PerM
VLLVLLFSLALLTVLGVTLVPAVIEQLNQLDARLPAWIDSGSQQLQALQSWATVRRLPIDLSKLITQIEEQVSLQLQVLSGSILSFLLNAIGSILNLVLTIVLTFYLLLYGRQLWDGLFEWLPPKLGAQMRLSLRQNFHNYFVGQSILAGIMGLAMIIVFGILSVPFGLLFGLTVGVMALFPFGVGLSITVISFLIGLQNFWLGGKVLVVAIAVDQIIENGIAPRLLGGFTGLNPVWILISILLGAKIAGLLGVLIAVPFAGFVKSMALAFKARNQVIPSLDSPPR